MDQDDAGRALAGRFLILVGPAAVIGHRIAVEEAGFGIGIAGVVDQHDHRLALDIDALVIVPAVLRRDDAIADKDQVRAVERDLVGGALGPEHHVFIRGQAERLAIVGDVEAGRAFIQRDFQQRHRLEIAALIAGLETDAGHLVGDPLAGGDPARRGRRAALEFIVREGRDHAAHIGFRDRSAGNCGIVRRRGMARVSRLGGRLRGRRGGRVHLVCRGAGSEQEPARQSAQN